MDGEMEGLLSHQQETHADMQTQPGEGGHKSTSVMNTHADEEFS